MVSTRSMIKKEKFNKLNIYIKELPEEIEKYIKSYLVNSHLNNWKEIRLSKLYNRYEEYMYVMRIKINSEKLNKRYFISWIKNIRREKQYLI